LRFNTVVADIHAMPQLVLQVQSRNTFGKDRNQTSLAKNVAGGLDWRTESVPVIFFSRFSIGIVPVV
jgi:hypothetical protein